MTTPFLTLETLNDGELIRQFDTKLAEAAKILRVGPGKVTVKLEVTLETEPGSFRVDVDTIATLKASDVSKRESQALVYLVDGGFAAEPYKAEPIPFPSTGRA